MLDCCALSIPVLQSEFVRATERFKNVRLSKEQTNVEYKYIRYICEKQLCCSLYASSVFFQPIKVNYAQAF